MRREHRHRRRSRKFGSVNEYSLYTNRIYLLNAIAAPDAAIKYAWPRLS